MSATIVYEKTREPMWLESGLPISADVERRWNEMVGNLRSKFQLWERVAERVLNYDVYPWGALDAVERFHDSRGPRFANGWQVDAHGIIRAGVRIK